MKAQPTKPPALVKTPGAVVPKYPIAGGKKPVSGAAAKSALQKMVKDGLKRAFPERTN